jgi:basic membrane protein A
MKRGAVLALAALALLVGSGMSTDGARQLRIGFVFQTADVSSPFDRGAFIGLQRAVKELGVQGKAVTPAPKDASYLPSFTYLARQKYDLIMGLGVLEVPDVDTAARRFPERRFAIVDGSWKDLQHRPKNVLGTLFKTEEAGYLAGYLAALMEKRRPGKDVIGSIGGYPVATVDAFIAGFQAGARKADPGIKLLNGYSQDFVAPAKCKALALGQIARGAGVVFDVAGGCGLGVLEAAKEKGVWGIGVDVDQSSLGPHILTSVIKELDVAVFDIIRSLQQGTFRPGRDVVFDLRNNGVGLGKVSPKVPRPFLRELTRVRGQIVAGKIRVRSRLGR